jgi:hypothetical protein
MNAFRIDGQRAVVTGGGSYVNGVFLPVDAGASEAF